MRDLSGVLDRVGDIVSTHSDELKTLDAVAGDGDLGITVIRAFAALTSTPSSVFAGEAPEVLRSVGLIIAREAPSTCGTLIASGFLHAAKQLYPERDGDPLLFMLRLVQNLVEGVVLRGKAESGDKTMLDALVPARDSLERALKNSSSVSEAMLSAADAADEGVESTKHMTPKFGRAAWLGERSLGHADPGARLVAILFAAIAQQLVDGS